jgi:homoserine dehydrogenase
LLAVARRLGEAVSLQVRPVLLPANHLLAQVNGSMNAIMVCGDAAGASLHYGAGAGADETASAIVADLVDVARWAGVPIEHRIPSLAYQTADVIPLGVHSTDEHACSHYLRMDLQESAQTSPKLDELCSREGGLVMKRQWQPAGPSSSGSLALITHPCTPQAAQALAQSLQGLSGIRGAVQVLCVESLDPVNAVKNLI